MDYNEQNSLENAKNRAFKLSSLLFASLFGALTFLLYQIGLEIFSSSSAKQLRDEYGDSSITYTGLYIGHLCYFFANRFYNHLLKDVKGFKAPCVRIVVASVFHKNITGSGKLDISEALS